MRRITVPFFIPHAGCPHQCVFCNQKHISGRISMPDPAVIQDTVLTYTQTSHEGTWIEAAFFGGTFTALPLEIQQNYLQEALQLKNNGRIQAIRLSTRPDALGDDVLALLHKYRVDTVELGVQSFDEGVLIASGRGHTRGDVLAAHDNLKRKGFQTGIQLMPGLPLDTIELSIQGAKITASLRPDCVRIYPTVVIRDTPLETLFNTGEFTPLTLEEAVEVSASMYEIFEEAGIPVIRTGLHPLDPAEETSIIAGPYHTAFGFLVKCRMRRRSLQKLFLQHSPVENGSQLTLKLPASHYEEYIGHRRENILHFEEIYKIHIHCERTEKNIAYF